MGAFFCSSLFNKGKFGMEDVLNATLAGGVIIGSSSDLVVESYASIIIGYLGGFISSLGFNWLGTELYNSIGLCDICGVNNLHGIPGILGGIIGAITAAYAPDEVYGEDISMVFPERADGKR